jgi:small subunit ribosomal protein S4
MVNHALVRLNGKKVDIASIQVKPNDIITIKEKPATVKLAQDNIEKNKGWVTPTWLEVNNEKLTGKVVRLPVREDIKAPVNEQLIVELYSR